MRYLQLTGSFLILGTFNTSYSDAIALSLPMQLELLSILSYYVVVIEVAVVERAVIAPEYGWCWTLYCNTIILKFEI